MPTSPFFRISRTFEAEFSPCSHGPAGRPLNRARARVGGTGRRPVTTTHRAKPNLKRPWPNRLGVGHGGRDPEGITPDNARLCYCASREEAQIADDGLACRQARRRKRDRATSESCSHDSFPATPALWE